MIRASIGFAAVNDAVAVSMITWIGHAVSDHFTKLVRSKMHGKVGASEIDQQTWDEENVPETSRPHDRRTLPEFHVEHQRIEIQMMRIGTF
jgi:hypothetical protein